MPAAAIFTTASLLFGFGMGEVHQFERFWSTGLVDLDSFHVRFDYRSSLKDSQGGSARVGDRLTLQPIEGVMLESGEASCAVRICNSRAGGAARGMRLPLKC